MSDLYPMALRLDGLPVLVVGGGSVATRRVPALLAAGARVRVVSPRLTPALLGLAEAGRLEWAERVFESSDVDGAWLVQVAVDDPVAAAEVSRVAREQRVFCVRADDRHAATAWTPAITRHGNVTVAVMGGGDFRLAISVRDRIAAALNGPAGSVPAGSGVPAHSVAGSGVPAGSAVVTARPGDRVGGAAQHSSGAEEGGGARPGDQADGATQNAGDRVAGDATQGGGSVALVGGGPGDPELITVKGRRLLMAADVVVADRLGPALLLDELRPEVELIDVAKLPYGPAALQEEINRILVDRARDGRFVVRLKGGDPFVFGRGGEEMIACARAGVPVTVVPGVSSSISAPAAAGIPVTHRGVAHEFTVVSGHLSPDDPASLVNWPALAKLKGTLVILMGLRQLPSIVDALLAGGRDPQTPAAIIVEGTTRHQHLVPGKLSDLPTMSAGLRPPAVVVIGDVVPVLGKGFEH